MTSMSSLFERKGSRENTQQLAEAEEEHELELEED